MSKAPAIGVGTSCGADPKAIRTTCIRMSEMPQTPKERVQRLLIPVADERSFKDETQQSDKRSADQETAPDRPPQHAADHAAVGAEHDELAVGQVDDVHEPVDDGQSHGHEYEDADDGSGVHCL